MKDYNGLTLIDLANVEEISFSYLIEEDWADRIIEDEEYSFFGDADDYIEWCRHYYGTLDLEQDPEYINADGDIFHVLVRHQENQGEAEDFCHYYFDSEDEMEAFITNEAKKYSNVEWENFEED